MGSSYILWRSYVSTQSKEIEPESANPFREQTCLLERSDILCKNCIAAKISRNAQPTKQLYVFRNKIVFEVKRLWELCFSMIGYTDINTPIFQPIRSENKTKRLFWAFCTRFFPRLRLGPGSVGSLNCNYDCSDWSDQLRNRINLFWSLQRLTQCYFSGFNCFRSFLPSESGQSGVPESLLYSVNNFYDTVSLFCRWLVLLIIIFPIWY